MFIRNYIFDPINDFVHMIRCFIIPLFFPKVVSSGKRERKKLRRVWVLNCSIEFLGHIKKWNFRDIEYRFFDKKLNEFTKFIFGENYYSLNCYLFFITPPLLNFLFFDCRFLHLFKTEKDEFNPQASLNTMRVITTSCYFCLYSGIVSRFPALF